MSDDFVTVAKCLSLPEAEACRLGLEAEGMTVCLTDAETILADWLLSNAVGSIKVQVPESQAANAATILEQIRQRHDEHAKHSDQDFCLSCGVAMPKTVTQCQSCGWSYDDGDGETSETDDAA